MKQLLKHAGKHNPSRRNRVDGSSMSRRLPLLPVLHTSRCGERLFLVRDPSIWICVGLWWASSPCRSTHEPLMVSHGCTMPRQCCLLRAEVLLRGPWLVLGDLYPYILTNNNL